VAGGHSADSGGVGSQSVWRGLRCHWVPRTESGINIITAFIFIVVAAIVRGGPLELFLCLQLDIALPFNLWWRVPHRPFVGSAIIHDTSAYLFYDDRIEMLFKRGRELVFELVELDFQELGRFT